MKRIAQKDYQEAAEILKNGGIVAFPTETVFGLGVIFDNQESYNRLIQVKERPPEKPFTLMCGSKEEIDNYAFVNEKARALIRAFMPGQFTLILPAKSHLPWWCVSKEGFVGIRVPDYPLIQKLIKQVGKPLLVPSANKSGEKPAVNDEEVINCFNEEIDGVIEGSSVSNIPSTIVIIEKDIQVIREGLISKDQIINVLEAK